jgi:hypothetical protein
VREPWEIPGLVVEPDDPEDDEDDYDDDDDDYDDEPRGRAARGRSRSAGGPPLGSYESRRAALSQPKRRSPARFILPVLALVAIGFGADKLFAARPGTQLAIAGNQPTTGATSSAPAPAPAVPDAAGTTAVASFAGYQGQQGRDGGHIAVSSVAAAGGGQELAVGSADGYPAVWRQGPASSWSLAGTPANGALAGRPGNQTLVAVTHGPAGWLAVGGVVSGAQQHPVVVTSPDGQAWQAADGSAAFAAPGLYAYGAAAGRIDYVIVGEQVTGNTTAPAVWWSAGLGQWSSGSVTGAGGSTGSGSTASGSTGSGGGQQSEMFAVTVGARRFIAAGADGTKPAVWTSPNGQQWTVTDLALPAGMSKAALRQVVSNGTRVVAAGNAATAQGATVAFAEVSTDDGITWHEATLPSPGPQAAVTALSASGAGYVAAGQSGQPGGTQAAAVLWTSPDGMNWAPARRVPDPAGGTVAVITSLTSAGGTVSGVGVASGRSGASPVVYTAPVP